MPGSFARWKRGAPCALILLWACTAPPENRSEIPPPPLETAGNIFLASALASVPPPGFTLADLPEPSSAGAKATERMCTACHALPTPATHSATDWPVVLRRMWLRIDRVATEYEIPVPTAADRLQISQYMVRHALVVTGAMLPDYLGREYFMLTCARCHALPDPRQHASQDWPAVVVRMREHMVELLGDAPSHAETRDIISYLEQVSSDG